MSDDADKPDRGTDVALLCCQVGEGENEGVGVIRAREGRVEAGVLQPLREGRPLVSGEVVSLRPRENTPWLCDVEVQHKVAPAPPGADPVSDTVGPPRVSSRQYREGYERIFGGARKPTAPN